jgi:hypothetical protein
MRLSEQQIAEARARCEGAAGRLEALRAARVGNYDRPVIVVMERNLLGDVPDLLNSLPLALDDLAESRERVRLLEAVAEAAWQEREAQRHFIATRAMPCRPVLGEQIPPRHPLLQAWCAATEATTATLAAAGYGKEASDAHA